MSPHHTDQMSQWSQVSRIALCMAKVNVSQSVSDLLSHLLSCSGQLKIMSKMQLSLTLLLWPLARHDPITEV